MNASKGKDGPTPQFASAVRIAFGSPVTRHSTTSQATSATAAGAAVAIAARGPDRRYASIAIGSATAAPMNGLVSAASAPRSRAAKAGAASRLRVHDREEHACREDQEIERRAGPCRRVVIDRDEGREICERDKECEIRDQHAREEIGVGAAAEKRRQNTDEERIEGEVGVIRGHRSVAVVRDVDVGFRVPPCRRVEKRIGRWVAHVGTRRRGREERDRSERDDRGEDARQDERREDSADGRHRRDARCSGGRSRSVARIRSRPDTPRRRAASRRSRDPSSARAAASRARAASHPR